MTDIALKATDLEVIRAKIEVTVQQANPRLVSLPAPPLNDTSAKETQTNDKAHLG